MRRCFFVVAAAMLAATAVASQNSAHYYTCDNQVGAVCCHNGWLHSKTITAKFSPDDCSRLTRICSSAGQTLYQGDLQQSQCLTQVTGAWLQHCRVHALTCRS
jgi:hypothetical protein